MFNKFKLKKKLFILTKNRLLLLRKIKIIIFFGLILKVFESIKKSSNNNSDIKSFKFKIFIIINMCLEKFVNLKSFIIIKKIGQNIYIIKVCN